jgi:hypothetical protein
MQPSAAGQSIANDFERSGHFTVFWSAMTESTVLSPKIPSASPESTGEGQLGLTDSPIRRGPLRRLFSDVAVVFEWLLGAVALVVGLAVLATVSIAGFASLGYLLEATGRVGRSGKLRDGLVGIRKAARIGGVLLVTALWWLPLNFLASLRADAELIQPHSAPARHWSAALAIVTLLAVAHVGCGLLRGGRLRHFLIPPNPLLLLRLLTARGFHAARDGLWQFVVGLRLPHYFRLGLCGAIGALVWLGPPITMLVLWHRAPLVAFVGAVLFAWALCYVPFLQAQFAAQNRFSALFEIRAVRERFRRAPLAFWFAFLCTLALALPLYLLKIELLPRELTWLPSLLFVLFMFPARLVAGWAYWRSEKRVERRAWLSRILARLGMLPVVFVYVLIVFFSQFTAWYGVWSLYEQHAFLLPAPFVGL